VSTALRDGRIGALADSVDIQYLGLHAGPTAGHGKFMVYVPGLSVPFLMLNWWVA